MSAPVTVSVTRHVDPSHTTQMLAWMQAGTSMAEKFDGFLGSGCVRPSADSTDWHMLYRFSDAESLAAWEASPQRAWWLEAAAGDVEESRRERRTGIEGWFDEPASVEAMELNFLLLEQRRIEDQIAAAGEREDFEGRAALSRERAELVERIARTERVGGNR